MREIWNKIKIKFEKIGQLLKNDKILLIIGYALIALSLLSVRSEINMRQLEFESWPIFLFSASYYQLSLFGLISLWLQNPILISLPIFIPPSSLGILILSKISYIPPRVKQVTGFSLILLSAISLAGETFSPSSISHFGDSGPVWTPGIFLCLSGIIGFFILFPSHKVFWGPILMFFGVTYSGLWVVDLIDYFHNSFFYRYEKVALLFVAIFSFIIGFILYYSEKQKILKQLALPSFLNFKHFLRMISFAAFIVNFSIFYSLQVFIVGDYSQLATFFIIYFVLFFALYFFEWLRFMKIGNQIEKGIYADFLIASHVLGSFFILFLYPYYYYFILPLAFTEKWCLLPIICIGIVGIITLVLEHVFLGFHKFQLNLIDS